MDNLPTLKKFGEQLDLLKRLIKEEDGEQADFIAQNLYENYAYARDAFLSQEDEVLGARHDISKKDERIQALEGQLKEAYSVHNSDFQLFAKFGRALQYVNGLKSLVSLSDMLTGVAQELGLGRIAVVLDRELCKGMPCPEIPTFYLKGCMRYIDATLNNGSNRVFLGPISRMMRPDVFFGDPEVGPEMGGSCFAFGMIDKYNPGSLSVYSLYTILRKIVFILRWVRIFLNIFVIPWPRRLSMLLIMSGANYFVLMWSV